MMNLMESSLPPAEEILEERERNTMKLVRICVTDLPITSVTTTLFVSTERIEPFPLTGALYTIDDDRVRGYIPTKSLLMAADSHDQYYGDVELEMVFFCSPSLPDQVRPFGTGKTHVLFFRVTPDMVIEYDINLRILIDQQVVSSTGEVYYIVVFGDKQYNDIVITQDPGEVVAVEK